MIVRESINFERGRDPRDSMNIGLPIIRILNRLKIPEPELSKLVKKIKSLPPEFFLMGRGDSSITDIKKYKELTSSEKKSLAIWYASSLERDDKYKTSPGFIWIKVKYNFSTDEIEEWMDIDKFSRLLSGKLRRKFLQESINFERGLEPKTAAGIGLLAPRKFKTIEEFTDYIITALPVIFNGKIPEDILSKEEPGMLPEKYYGKIAWWLSENGFEMPNGNNEWEGPIDNSPREFAYWTTSIVQRLEQMLGQKRWSEYD